MGDYNFDECNENAKMYEPVWNGFWMKKYPKYSINRNLPEEVDRKLGVDVVLSKKDNRRMLVDEKIEFYYGFETYCIEVMSNLEEKKAGWGYNEGVYVAKVHVDEGNFLNFRDEPVVFFLDKLFQKRILGNPLFPIKINSTEKKYRSAFKPVPRAWLENFRNDSWVSMTLGVKQTKIDDFLWVD